MFGAEQSRLRRRPARRALRGLSLIELMIGLVIAMMIGIVATGSAMMFLSSQRQGVAATGSLLNANAALSALKHEVAAAGLGFYGDALYRCKKLNLGAGSVALWDGLAFVPVRITRAAGQDMIDVLQASRVEAGAGAPLSAASSGADAILKSYLPAGVGDAVLLSSSSTTTPCLVRSVTAVKAASDDNPLQLQFGPTGLHNAASFSANPSFGSEDGTLTLLGTLRWQRYRLANGQLLIEQPLTGASAPLIRQAIALRAQYGLSSGVASSTSLDSWQPATGTFASLSATDLPRVRALRVGLVVRSTQRDKPRPDGTCDASTSKPVLFGETIEPDVTDWQCWRFRVVVVVVPMQNLMLGSGT